MRQRRLRILATTNAAIGHFLPMAPTLAALVAAGHDVRVGCPARFATFVERCGFTAFACAEESVDVDVPPLPPSGDRVGRLRWATVHSWPADCRSWVDRLWAIATDFRPDVVVVEPVEHAGRVVAAALEVPLAVHGWGFTLAAGTDGLATETLADIYARLGAGPAAPRMLVDLGPPGVQAAGAAKATRFAYVPWRVAGEPVPPRNGKRRALLTLGTYPNPRAAELIRDAARAAAAAGVEVLVVLGNVDRDAALGAIPGVRTVSWTDMRAAIASSDVVIHHGGTGTAWTTLVGGRPAVVLPQGADQFDNAALLSAAGAALVVEDAADVGFAVVAALSGEELARNARRLARENAAMSGPRVLASELASLALPR